MSDIFISYAREDLDTAKRLAAVLERQRWSVFWDRTIPAGKVWRDVIGAALADARSVVVLWSQHSVASHWVLEEADYGLRRGALIPAFIENVKPPFGFGSIQAADLSTWGGNDEDEAIKQFFGDLASVLGPAPVVPSAERPKAEAEAQHKGTEHQRQQAEAETIGEQTKRLMRSMAEEEKEAKRKYDERQRRRTARATVATKQNRAPSERTGSSERKPGTVFRDIEQSWCPELMVIPAGSFVMGAPEDEAERSSDEGPQHRVTFPRPFALGRYPVTFEEYDHYCIETGREKPGDEGWGRGRRPVINVSWEDAQAYCAWLSQQAGQPYRLPSEAEWEYACRAGTTTPFWTGATISADQANYDGNYTYGPGRKGEYRRQTTPVDTFEANPWGLHDMHGNVWERVEDCWNDSYRGAPTDGSAWPQGNCSLRVVRGGSWGGKPGNRRSANRDSSNPGNRNRGNGFRVARTLTP